MFRPVMNQRRRTPVPAEIPKSETPQLNAQLSQPPMRGRLRAPRPRPPVEMTATGPFALGPMNRPSSRQRSAAPRPAPAATIAPPTSTAATIADDYTSDDEGVRFIDIRRVQDLDAMAPQSLLEPPGVKKEEKDSDVPQGDTQALELSDNEPEEGEADVAGRFASSLQGGGSDQGLFLFQFPQVLPQFSTVPPNLRAKDEDEVMPEASDSAGAALPPAPEGEIGRLDMYRDGRTVLMIGDVPFELNDGCETSFLQQLMLLDPNNQEAICLGELSNKFVATPQLDYLLRSDEEHNQVSGS